MKATVIMGSPRGTKGASSRIAQQFSAGLRRAGVDVTEIVLKDYTIKHCIGCYTCWTKTPGKCVHRDDMDKLLPFWQTDLLVWATPLYYYNVPGLVKDVLDRQLPLIEPFLVSRGETTSHPRRGSAPAPATFLISAAGFPERSHFDVLVAHFKKFSSKYIGDILVGAAEPMSRNELQDAYTDLYQLAEQAGFEVGKDGRVSQETTQAILDKTTYSPEKIAEFRSISNNYWESLFAKVPAPTAEIQVVSDRMLQISDGGIATFLAGMALKYNPNALPGFTGVIQFKFEAESYHLLIREGKCQAYQGEHPTPTLTIITPQQVWLDISSGDLNGTKAFMDGLYKTEGDLNLLMQLNSLFGTETADRNEPAPEKASVASPNSKIPEHRGPIHLRAMTWLTVAFVPWMLFWILGSFLPGSVVRTVAAGVAVLIAGYHLTTNVVTLFEAGTAIYLVCSAVLRLIGWEFFVQFGGVIDYVFLGGLWLVSIVRRFALTSEYSRYLFPKVVWKERSFTETNAIICAAWGVYFLVAALLRLMMATENGPQVILMLLNYGLLIPMFIFTDRFQKWYPAYLLRAR